MKIFKWTLVIAITVAATCVLMSTFMQREFMELVDVKIFSWDLTRPLPIYIFVAASFGIGLFIGFFAAAYYYIAGQAGMHSKKKEIRALEETVSEKENEIARLVREKENIIKKKDAEIAELRSAQPSGKSTKSQKALAERDFI